MQVVGQARTRMPDGDRCLKQYGLLWGPGGEKVAGKGTVIAGRPEGAVWS